MADPNAASSLTSRTKVKKRSAADLIASSGRRGLSDSKVAGPGPQDFKAVPLKVATKITGAKPGLVDRPGFQGGGPRPSGAPRFSVPKGEMPVRRIPGGKGPKPAVGAIAKPLVGRARNPGGPKKGPKVRPMPKPMALTDRSRRNKAGRGRARRPGYNA